MSSAAASRRWLAPEVVQTSAMDCGPATLKSVLEGFGVPVSYGRLREACQTDVDGTSIDTLEVVAQQLGVRAEQVMIPHDHVLLPAAQTLPAIVVVRHASGATHFVVAWRRFGDWLQVMDPATGRRWLRSRQFAREMFEHQTTVDQAAWRAWAASDEFALPLRQRVVQLGASEDAALALVHTAQADPTWFACAALDASVRLVQSVVQAGGLASGSDACTLMQTVFRRACEQREHHFAVIAQAYWSVVPAPTLSAAAPPQLQLRGAVLLRLRGLSGVTDAAAAADATKPPLSRELQAALREKQPHPLRTIWGLLREDGLLGPVALMGAMGLAAGALVMQTLLWRGLFDIGGQLGLAHQRLVAWLALLAFVVLLLALEVPIVSESLRYGRHLEVRLRLALLAKLPRLSDRYFQSRSVSDMAERSHSLQLARHTPVLGLNFVQSFTELVLTLIGLIWIAPHSAGFALAIVAAAIGVPLALQPLLNERDLRLRNQAAALNGFYLDALLGLVPVRSHRAERNVARQHESLLVQWARATRGMNLLAIGASSVQGTLCMGLAAWLLVDHFLRAGAVSGADLLLVYWTMKLPALGSGVGSLARQYPAQRNVLLRLFEPLTSPEEPQSAAASLPVNAASESQGMAIRITEGSVLAAGFEILRDIQLHIAPGEHVAIVGASGAGKSSLVGLLLGWHRLASGTLQVDGAALDSAGQILLRQHTAWVDPGVQLWNRSLLDNLLFASDEQGLARIGAVIDAAGLRGVLAKLPQGLQTPLGEGGALLSGGEGQRVRLGRAMLQSGVRLALLDEPFRGLDREQRRALLTDARRWWQDATLLCVTHDVGETLGFSRVLVVDNGRIVEDGAPALLSVQDSRYATMLRAEQEVQQQMWQTGSEDGSPDGNTTTATTWRHLRIAQGVTVNETAATQ